MGPDLTQYENEQQARGDWFFMTSPEDHGGAPLPRLAVPTFRPQNGFLNLFYVPAQRLAPTDPLRVGSRESTLAYALFASLTLGIYLLVTSTWTGPLSAAIVAVTALSAVCMIILRYIQVREYRQQLTWLNDRSEQLRESRFEVKSIILGTARVVDDYGFIDRDPISPKSSADIWRLLEAANGSQAAGTELTLDFLHEAAEDGAVTRLRMPLSEPRFALEESETTRSYVQFPQAYYAMSNIKSRRRFRTTVRRRRFARWILVGPVIVRIYGTETRLPMAVSAL